MRPVVGPETPVNLIKHGRYTGDSVTLENRTALISEAPQGGWFVQVDGQHNTYAYGWWYFPQGDWQPDPEPD